MTTKKPAAPSGAKSAGRALWRSVVDVYDLDEHETALLVQAVRTVDLLDVLQADVDANGATVESPQGRKTNPSVVEIRQQRLALARLLAALRLPQGDEADTPVSARLKRPQRRGGVRAPQRLGVVL